MRQFFTRLHMKKRPNSKGDRFFLPKNSGFKRLQIILSTFVIVASSSLAVLLQNSSVWAASPSDSSAACTAAGGTLASHYSGSTLVSACDTATSNSSSDTKGLDWEIQSWWYYNALSQCLKTAGDNIWQFVGGDDKAQAKSGQWFVPGNYGTAPASYYMKGLLDGIGDDGQIDCDEAATDNSDNTQIVPAALKLWGLDSLSFLCDSHIVVRAVKGEDCITGKGDDFSMTDDRGNPYYTVDFAHSSSAPAGNYESLFQAYVIKNVYGGKTPTLEPAAQYLLYYQSLQNSPCIGTTAYSSEAGIKTAFGNNVTSLQIAQLDATSGKMVKVWYKLNDLNGGVNWKPVWTSTNPNANSNESCKTLAAKINDPTSNLSVAYQLWSKAHHDKTGTSTGGGGTTTQASTACAIPGGLGWIICPVLGFLSSITDGAFSIVSGLLVTDTSTIATGSGNGAFDAWSTMRNFANVGFVIVFLVIIFSQISSIGITNYGVKKLLPRLIIVAILVNVSFFVCQIAVDVSNIVGGSLQQLLTNIPVYDPNNSDGLAKSLLNSATPLGDAVTATVALPVGVTVLAGTALAAYFAGLGLLIPVLLAALLSVAVTLGILIIRQVLIILLVVLSPLAFLAMLLPNTESLFKQWRKMIVGMLVVYPLIALLFGASKLASEILSTAIKADSHGIIAMAALFVPLLLTPVLLKNSLSAIPALGSLATKLQNRANGFAGRKGKELYNATPIARGRAIRKQARENYRSQKFAERVGEGGLAALMAKGLPTKGAGAYANKTLARTSLIQADKADTDDVQAEKASMLVKRLSLPQLEVELKNAILKGDSVKARAAQSILVSSGEAGKVAHDRALRDLDTTLASTAAAVSAGSATPEQRAQNSNIISGYDSLRRNLKFNHSDIKSSDAIADKFMNSAPGSSYGDAVTQMGPKVQQPDGSFVGGGLAGLNPTQLIGQPLEFLQQSGINRAQAQALLGNPAVQAIMSPDKAAYLSSIK